MLVRLKAFLKSFNILWQDWIRYEIFGDQKGYLRIRNRMEKLGDGPVKDSYVCLWPYTSRLRAVEEWAYVGKHILKKAIRDNQFAYHDNLEIHYDVDISIIIGHRGTARLGLLLTTLKCFAAQIGIQLECIVVEQDSRRNIERYLPTWVRYLYQEMEGGEIGYNRSAAFNFGAIHAKGRVLLLHDNDMLVPKNYCSAIMRVVKEGYKAINAKRFVFYLDKGDSDRLHNTLNDLGKCTPLYVVQNLEAGGSMAIDRNAYFEIGGMDEGFIGWGGEDNEFWKRCSHLKRWIWGFAPIIHLWHESQPLKEAQNNVNLELAKSLHEEEVMERIKKVRERNIPMFKKLGWLQSEVEN